MKLLDRALQYTVYDLGNGRVFKRRNTYQEQSAVIRSWKVNSLSYQISKIFSINLILRRSLKKIKHLTKQYPAFSKLIGNPKFEDHNYTQDKVIQMGNYLLTHSLAENKRIIDEYIKLTHNLWTYGVHDLIYNFHLNNGVTQAGSVIQIDFGECGFTKSSLQKKIIGKHWKQQQGYEFLNNLGLQPYLSQRLDQKFTLEKAEELWGLNLQGRASKKF